MRPAIVGMRPATVENRQRSRHRFFIKGGRGLPDSGVDDDAPGNEGKAASN